MHFTTLQKLCLKHHVSVEELFRLTGIPPNKLRAILSGKKKIDEMRADHFERIFEEIDGKTEDR
tara:strand:- start:419 stop:610 length:192 start_codon:yes stop_codon:yes gene_type:complete